jgi:hypothetical protein
MVEERDILTLVFRAGLIFRINEGGFELDDCAREGGGEMPTSKPEKCHANSNENAGRDGSMTAHAMESADKRSKTAEVSVCMISK